LLNKSVFFGLLLFSSCKDGFTPDVQKLYDEVMVIHDEVMPEMGTIHNLKKKLKKVLKDPEAEFDAKMINEQITALDYADDSMMDWMHQFKVPKDASEEEQLVYLEDQKQKMTKVNLEMKSIIKNARNAVKPFK